MKTTFFEAYQHHGYRPSVVGGVLTAGQNQTIRGDTPIIVQESTDENICSGLQKLLPCEREISNTPSKRRMGGFSLNCINPIVIINDDETDNEQQRSDDCPPIGCIVLQGAGQCGRNRKGILGDG